MSHTQAPFHLVKHMEGLGLQVSVDEQEAAEQVELVDLEVEWGWSIQVLG